MIPDLKDNRLVCNLCCGNLELDGVVVSWVGCALHFLARLHLLIKVVNWNPSTATYIGMAGQEHGAHIAVWCPSKKVCFG